MNFERITTYQLENYFTELTHIHMLKLAHHVMQPVGFYKDVNNTIHLVTHEKKSLYEQIHD